MQISPSVGCFVLVPSKVSFPYPWEGTFAEPLVLYLFFSLSLPLSLSVITLRFILILILSRRVTRRFRIANHMVMDSCCRGGIVDTRGGCSRALFVPPKSPTALWRFRASTSNSLSAALGCTLARICRIFTILTLNKIFENVEMTICSRPRGSTRTPRRFRFFA